MKKYLLGIAFSILLLSCEKDPSSYKIKEKEQPCEDPLSLTNITGLKPDWPCLMPQTQRKALLVYFTGVQCQSSGDWGNQLYYDILKKSDGKAIPFIIRFYDSDPYLIRDFVDTFTNRFLPNSGYSPYICAENTTITGIDTIYSVEVALERAQAEIQKISSQAALIAPALRVYKVGSSINIYYGFRFEKEVTGQFSFGLYIAEDKLNYPQMRTGTNSDTSPYYHNNVIRKVVDGLPYGFDIADDHMVKGSIYLGRKTVPFLSDWKSENSHVIGVIWYTSPSGKKEVVNVIDAVIE